MFKQVLNGRLIASVGHEKTLSRRPLFYWLTVIFNRVDSERIKEVGPDRACAEWLLKNGAYVKWQNSSEYLTDYNFLLEEKGTKYIQAVKAVDAGITYVGFPYFDGCKHIEKVKLIDCRYICNTAMHMLSYLKDSLKHLEVIGCASVTDEGLSSLKNLKNLKILKLGEMPYLQNPDAIKKELTECLPNTEIEMK
ncbi:hypothetical protein KPH14_011136 [Odynerus spinipes]|uniref:F-box/LRR-repeat protein 15-like leucin rich repeat domain-containing protein n=1 Tax=Odynerus spinipes TaxID=1348599 RepID=A0AAD9VM71_9HYME|nr:hypothetical protein KPH14_011136 [Odynerus spinipes]